MQDVVQFKTNVMKQLQRDGNNVHTSSSVVSVLLPLFIGKPLPNSLECMSAPYSTVTSSSMLLTNLQNSLSTSSVGTIYRQHAGSGSVFYIVTTRAETRLVTTR